MKGSTHLTIGAASSLLISLIAPYKIWYLALGALGGLFPDIDADQSKIKNIGFKIGKIKIKPLWLPVAILDKFFKHRGFTHSVLGLLSFSGIFYFLDANFLGLGLSYVLSFALGYLFHLVSDAMTVSGVPLLCPLSKKRINLLPKRSRIRTGTWIESYVNFVFITALASYLIYLFILK